MNLQNSFRGQLDATVTAFELGTRYWLVERDDLRVIPGPLMPFEIIREIILIATILAPVEGSHKSSLTSGSFFALSRFRFAFSWFPSTGGLFGLFRDFRNSRDFRFDKRFDHLINHVYRSLDDYFAVGEVLLAFLVSFKIETTLGCVVTILTDVRCWSTVAS